MRLFWVAILFILASCVTVQENVIDSWDCKEYGNLIEMVYFKKDSVYYNGQWKYITGKWTRLWRDGTSEEWGDTIIVFIMKEKQL